MHEIIYVECLDQSLAHSRCLIKVGEGDNGGGDGDLSPAQGCVMAYSCCSQTSRLMQTLTLTLSVLKCTLLWPLSIPASFPPPHLCPCSSSNPEHPLDTTRLLFPLTYHLCHGPSSNVILYLPLVCYWDDVIKEEYEHLENGDLLTIRVSEWH